MKAGFLPPATTPTPPTIAGFSVEIHKLGSPPPLEETRLPNAFDLSISSCYCGANRSLFLGGEGNAARNGALMRGGNMNCWRPTGWPGNEPSHIRGERGQEGAVRWCDKPSPGQSDTRRHMGQEAARDNRGREEERKGVS